MIAPCSACRRAVTIADEHAGRDVQCPWCREVFRAPPPRPAPVPPAAPPRIAGGRTAPRAPAAPGPTPAAPAPRPLARARTCLGCSTPLRTSNPYCVSCRAVARSGLGTSDDEPDPFAPEMAVLSMGRIGGLVLVVVAVVWFVWGYAEGYIFYYPPVLALIGLYGIVTGGPQRPVSTRRRRRPTARP